MPATAVMASRARPLYSRSSLMFRRTAFLLIVSMTLGSGRLLVCGWDCQDGRATAQAPCHEADLHSATLDSATAHPCPPDRVQLPVTVSIKDSTHYERLAHWSTSVPATVAVPSISSNPTDHFSAQIPVFHPRVVAVLRI